MDNREAARWLVVFLMIVGGWYAYDRVWTARAFGIDRAMRSEAVTVRANVISISGGKGHVFPILKDPSNNKTIKGVLFRSDEEPEENRLQRELLAAARRDGTLVTIEGIVEIYNDALEIVIRKVY